MPAFGEQFKPYYPGLKPVEAYVWREWLKNHEAEFDRFLYNIHVGPGVKIPAELLTRGDELERAYADAWEKATQHKVDCIGLRASEWWVFEVEERATNVALGQLLSYQSLLLQTVVGLGPTELAVVCRSVAPGMLEVFEENGVLVFEVELAPFPG